MVKVRGKSESLYYSLLALMCLFVIEGDLSMCIYLWGWFEHVYLFVKVIWACVSVCEGDLSMCICLWGWFEHVYLFVKVIWACVSVCEGDLSMCIWLWRWFEHVYLFVRVIWACVCLQVLIPRCFWTWAMWLWVEQRLKKRSFIYNMWVHGRQSNAISLLDLWPKQLNIYPHLFWEVKIGCL